MVAVPLLSFVVIAYNVQPYIIQCLQSVKAQTLDDFEVIVVDDASTDGTLECITREVADDQRFHIIAKSENEGAHLARRTGALATKGQYVYFVDGDDSISALLCEQVSMLTRASSPDIIRFGLDAFPEIGADDGTAIAVEAVFNNAQGMRTSREIIETAFSDIITPRDVWSVTVCAYRGDSIRESFSKMTSKRLGYMEDTYEFFVIANESQTLQNYADFRALKYRIGAGRSGRRLYSAEEFSKRQREVHEMYLLLCEYCNSQRDDTDFYSRTSLWMKRQYLLMLVTDWVTRLPAADQDKGYTAIVETWGAADAAIMLFDPLIARGESLLSKNSIPPGNDEFYRWGQILAKIVPMVDDGRNLPRYDQYRQLEQALEHHVAEIQLKEQQALQAEQERIEAQARFKKGTLMRRVIDKVMPAGSLNRDLVSVIRSHAQRAKRER